MATDARQHVLSEGHNLERFDAPYLGTRGYHCIECGKVWQITPYDTMASTIRQQGILECAELPGGFDILLAFLNAESEEECPLKFESIPSILSRYERTEPI